MVYRRACFLKNKKIIIFTNKHPLGDLFCPSDAILHRANDYPKPSVLNPTSLAISRCFLSAVRNPMVASGSKNFAQAK